MNESAAQKLAGPVHDLHGRGADGAGIAGAAVDTWQAVAAALTPVIGPLGFSALYGRATKLASGAHDWLEIEGLAADTAAFALLHEGLVRRPVADSVAAHVALVQEFCNVLTSLVGASLTERLLCPVWDPPTSGTSAEQNSP